MSQEVNNQNDALQVLINVAKIAVKRGAFELEEVELILNAVKAFSVNKVEELGKAVADISQEVEKAV